jgi:threonine dehydrogenase-like Zn-dependent dehydrogenase
MATVADQARSMRAAVIDEEGLRVVRDRPILPPAPGEVRIRTLLAGICNTDLEILRGYAGFQGVPGHEFVGLVDEGPDVDPSLVGRRVVGEINVGCGTCETCRAGRGSHCPNRTALGIRGRDGALAEHFSLPRVNLHAVPDSIPDEAAVFVEPLAAACRILEQVHVGPGQRVVVLGDGKLGLLVAQVLALTASRLTVVGRHPDKLSILARRGIETRIDGQELDEKADLVVECTGQPGGLAAARRLLRPAGTLVLKSTYHGPVEVDFSAMVVDEIRVVGSRCGPFAPALRMLAQGLVDVSSLVEAEYRLDQAVAAFEHAGRKGALKVLVRP